MIRKAGSVSIPAFVSSATAFASQVNLNGLHEIGGSRTETLCSLLVQWCSSFTQLS